MWKSSFGCGDDEIQSSSADLINAYTSFYFCFICILFFIFSYKSVQNNAQLYKNCQTGFGFSFLSHASWVKFLQSSFYRLSRGKKQI